MEIPVPPIIRDGFHYDGQLQVDIGGKLHPRASESDIKACLNGWQQDRVGHWWEAQVVHYDIARSRVKDTCKARLQQALGQYKLAAQPAHLAALEAKMAKEYNAAVRRANAQAKPKSSKPWTPAKRSRAEDSKSAAKRTKLALRVDGIEIEIDQSAAVQRSRPENARRDQGGLPSPRKYDKDLSNDSDLSPRDHANDAFQRSPPSQPVVSQQRTQGSSYPEPHPSAKRYDPYAREGSSVSHRYTSYPAPHASARRYDPYAREDSDIDHASRRPPTPFWPGRKQHEVVRGHYGTAATPRRSHPYGEDSDAAQRTENVYQRLARRGSSRSVHSNHTPAPRGERPNKYEYDMQWEDPTEYDDYFKREASFKQEFDDDQDDYEGRSPTIKPDPDFVNDDDNDEETHHDDFPSYHLNHDDYPSDTDAMRTRPTLQPSLQPLAGTYTLQTPTSTDPSLHLTLILDHASSEAFGTFHLATFSGLIKLSSVDIDREVTFGWRAQHPQTGKMLLGRGCCGRITFYGDWEVRGEVFNLFGRMGEGRFEGWRRSGLEGVGRSVEDLREEWEEFRERATGRRGG